MQSLLAAVCGCILCLQVALARPYNESRAIMFANLAGASYCKSSLIQDWDCGSKCDAVKGVSSIKMCEASSTQAFVALWEGKCVVSFKGTNSVGDVFADLEVWHDATPWEQCSGCKVHAGFLATYMSLRDCVHTSLKEIGCPEGSAIRTTGHSLGAGANALAMIDLTASGWIIDESYDFARPRVGGEDVAEMLNTKFGDRTWRITRERDPIPLVPEYLVSLHWTHSMPEVYYKGSYNSDGYEICSTNAESEQHCSEQHSPNPVFIYEHEHYMDVSIGTFGCKWFSQDSSNNSDANILI